MILLFLPLKGMEVHAGDSISGYVNASAITASNIQLSGSTTINMDTDLELWTLRGPYDLTITGSGKLTVSSNSGPAIQAKQLRMENTGVFAYSADSNAIEVAEFLYAHDSWVEAKGVDSGIYVAWGNATFDNCMATIIATAYNGLYAYTNATFLGGNIYVEGNTCGVHVSGGDLENLGGDSKYSKTIVCPDGCVIFKLTATPLGNENFHTGGFWDYPDETQKKENE